MSAPEPGVGTPPEPGTAPSGTASGKEPGAGSPASPSGGPENYLSRVEADPGFALQEVKNQQSRADRTEARHKQLLEKVGGERSQLLQLLETPGVDADTLSTFVQRYATLRQHPSLSKAIQQFESTGEIKLAQPGSSEDGSGDDLDEFDPASKKIRQLESELAQLRTQMGGLHSSTGQAALQRHLETFRDEFFLEETDAADLHRFFGEYVSRLDRNDPAVTNLLQTIARPDGYDTFATLALGHLRKNKPEAIRDIGQRKRLREQQELRRFATDGPSEDGSTGRELPADLEKKDAEEVIRFFSQNPQFL